MYTYPVTRTMPALPRPWKPLPALTRSWKILEHGSLVMIMARSWQGCHGVFHDTLVKILPWSWQGYHGDCAHNTQSEIIIYAFQICTTRHVFCQFCIFLFDCVTIIFSLYSSRRRNSSSNKYRRQNFSSVLLSEDKDSSMLKKYSRSYLRGSFLSLYLCGHGPLKPPSFQRHLRSFSPPVSLARDMF